MRDDFAVFILTHGRPDNVITLKTLQRGNYTGKWYMVVDNEDKTVDEYKKNFGDEHVIVFDKLAISKRFDTADTFQDRRTIVYARNACFDIAEELGLKYFLELDDDYTDFQYRFPDGNKLMIVSCKQLDRLFDGMLRFLDSSGALTVALAQGGDFIGGKNGGNYKKKVLRKAMNTFFCRTDKRFWFVGRVNEDVNTYTLLGNRGELIMSITDVCITQKQTQSNKGGMTDVYLDGGTFLKSFYSVLFSPQCVKISKMGDKHKRVHHKVNWNYCAPKILNEKYRKGGVNDGQVEAD